MITTYPKPWPGYTVPEFGGPLNGYETHLTPVVARSGESEFSIEQLSGLFDAPTAWIASLLGKPQSWYTRVEKAQNAFAVISAEVNAFGRGVWDSIQSSIAAEVAAGRGAGLPVRFPGFDWAVEDISAQVKGILITKSHTPTDQEIATAESRIPMYREAVDYAKYVVPEAVYQVEQDAAKVLDAVSRAPLRSPAEVGVEEFIKDLERRAKLFSMFGLAVVAIVAAAAVVGFMIYANLMTGGRRR